MQLNHIQLKNVSKSFTSSGQILREIDLDIRAGEFVVLLGPSGSGKSTLLRMIAGLDRCTSGEVQVNESSRFDKGFVFQDPHLMPWKNITENVALPLELMGIGIEERNQKAMQALGKVGLVNAAKLFPVELSGGMKMRASLARALVGQPNLLLLDEPFAALDEQTRFQLAEELRKLWKQYALTVVFVTHSLHEACFLGERVIILSKKPAGIQADIKIELPVERTNKIRTENIFSEQLKKIYGAME